MNEDDLYRIHSPRSKRRRKSPYPPRFEPYYQWGVGWFSDTRYLDKLKGGCIWYGFLAVVLFFVLTLTAGACNALGIGT